MFGLAATRNAARYQKPLAMLRFTGRGLLDALGSLAGRPPRLVPLTGGHYTPLLGGHEQAVAAEVSFLRRHLLGADRAADPADPAGAKFTAERGTAR